MKNGDMRICVQKRFVTLRSATLCVARFYGVANGNVIVWPIGRHRGVSVEVGRMADQLDVGTVMAWLVWKQAWSQLDLAGDELPGCVQERSCDRKGKWAQEEVSNRDTTVWQGRGTPTQAPALSQRGDFYLQPLDLRSDDLPLTYGSYPV